MSTEVESLELKILSNSESAIAGIDKLTESLNKLKAATSGLSSVAKGIGKVSDAANKSAKSSKNTTTANKELTKSFTDLFYKVKVGAKAFEVVGTKIWSAIKKSNDYIENVNLFSVSMGEYAGEAMEYAETVSDAMGIDTSEWIRNQGVFMTLTTGFGVAGDRAKTMSKNLTQLGYDLSSFYNISVGDAMQKLQSGMSGEIEPLRRLGYDLSQAKLEATALELGITKSVSAMTQAEKAQLRYHAILTQVTVTHGDMARTLDDPANQLRVLQAQVNMAAREIGNIFIPALNAILPYAIAVTKVIRSLASTIAGLFGYEMPEIGNAASQVVTNTDAVTENLKDSQEEAKKLKSYMLGFDELNVINPSTGSETESPLGEFDFELPEYDFMAGLVESKVATIVEEMKEWLGITDEIDSWSELLDTRLGHILKLVGLIGTGILAWRVTKTFMDSISALKLLLSNPKYAIAISAILTITGLTISFDGMKSAIQGGLDGFNFAEVVGGGLLSAGGAALLGSKIATWITTTFAGSKVAAALATAATNLGVGTAGAVGAALAAGIVGIIVGIPSFFVGIYDAIKNELDWLNGSLVGLGATAAGAGIGAIIGMLGGPIGAGIGALIGLAVGFVTDGILAIVDICKNGLNWSNGIILGIVGVFALAFLECVAPFLILPTIIIGAITLVIAYWEEVVAFFRNLPENIGTWFNGLAKNIKNWFANLWQPIKDYDWSKLGQDMGRKAGEALKQVWGVIKTKLTTFFEETLPTFFDETLPAFIEFVFTELPNKLHEGAIAAKEGLKKVGFEILRGIFEGMKAVGKAVWDFCAGFVQGFKDALGIKSPSTVFREIGVYLIKGLLGGITETWVNITTYFTTALKNLRSFFSTEWGKIKTTVTNVFDSMWAYIQKPINSIIGGVEKMTNGLINGVNSMIRALNNLSFSVPDWVPEIGGKTFGFNLSTISTISIPRLAEGGFPEQGQMFIAREAGAEMVGNIGRRTAVANNDQIVAGIAGGVAEANEEQNTLLREQNSLLRAILEKDSATYLDGRNLTNSVEKYQRGRGRVLITGGVL
jgi:hypothetical protein